MSYNTIEPTVIDEELLQKAISEQATGDAADIAIKEGIEMRELQALRLDYRNILKIDNLWAFENLTKLQLDNNIIEKIENIEHLVNLTWLDLSFNNISVIEGLGTLTKLTDLSLFNNRISKLENMDTLVNLKVLSVGNNTLQNVEELSYLYIFPNLRCLNVIGNPFCKNPDYKLYLLSRLKNLSYLDFRLVDTAMVKQAREKYVDDIIALEEESKVSNNQIVEYQKKEALLKLHTDAHIPGIDSLFSSLFSGDIDFQKLRLLAPTAIADVQETYRTKLEIVINELKHQVLRQHNLKTEEIVIFKKFVVETKAEVDKAGVKLLGEFTHIKKGMLKTIQTSRITKEIDDAVKTVKEAMDKLSDNLLGQELQLVEQFEDVIKEFERNYTDLCNGVNENAQSSFARMRELENEYHEKMTETVTAAFDKMSKMEVDELEEEIRYLLRDKDTIANMLTSSHDYHLSKFDSQEDALVTGTAADLERTIQQVHDDEIKRNRNRVIEVVTFMEKCLSEIEAAEEN